MGAGANCANTNSAATNTLTFSELVEYINAAPSRTCQAVPDMNICMSVDDPAWTPGGPLSDLPARGGAIIISAANFGAMKTAMELACRELGKRCTYEPGPALQVAKPVLR